MVAAKGNAAAQGSLFADGSGILLLGDGGQEDGGVVAKDTGKHHDNGDGDQDPVAGFGQHINRSTVLAVGSFLWECAYNNWGSL